MQRFRIRSVSVGLVALGALLLGVACGGDDPTATPVPSDPPAASGFEAEWAALIERAQAEGEIRIVLGGGDEKHLQGALDDFGDIFEIKVFLTLGSGRQNATKVLAERANGLYTQDVSYVGRSSVVRFIEAGALIPIRESLFHPEVIDESLWLGGAIAFNDAEQKYAVITSGEARDNIEDIFYNTDNVSQADIDAITSIDDLTDTDWRWVTLDPARAGTSVINWLIHPEAGEDWLRAFVLGNKDNITNIDADYRAIVDGLALGKYDFTFQIGDGRFQLIEAQRQGLPIGVLGGLGVQPMFTLSGGRAPHLLTRAPHPNAQKLFINWWLSRDGQESLMRAGETPIQSLRIDGISTGRVDPKFIRNPDVDYVLVGQAAVSRNIEAKELITAIYKEAGIPVFGVIGEE